MEGCSETCLETLAVQYKFSNRPFEFCYLGVSAHSPLSGCKRAIWG